MVRFLHATGYTVAEYAASNCCPVFLSSNFVTKPSPGGRGVGGGLNRTKDAVLQF